MTGVPAREAAWRAIDAHAHRLADARIGALIDADPALVRRAHLRVGGLLGDFSRQRIDAPALAALTALADASRLDDAIAAMYRGDIVNRAERRPVLHTALRAPLPDPGESGIAADAARSAHAVRGRMAALVAAWHAQGAERPLDVVHVGIGGSDLGPRLVCDALVDRVLPNVRVHFIANVDGGAVDRLVRTLDPERTRVCLVSKSFSTQETLLNGAVLRDWLATHLGDAAARERFVAISANVPAAERFGVPAANVLPMWDWVGGRYSLWSAVGLPIALACGMAAFDELLDGARAMDAHYRDAPPTANLPLRSALTGIWNRNALGHPSLAVIPYDDRLRLLPSFLQQLEMESNGKGVDAHGAPLPRAAVPVIWGEVGTNAQHAFFQSLHQSAAVVPIDFIGVARPAHGQRANHDALLANLVAQGSALMHGSDARDEPDPALRAQRASPGNRPSTTYLLDELTPATLGALLVHYEHKVHAQGVMWGVNSFDQWGVELGKQIAQTLMPAVQGDATPAGIDAATTALLDEIRRLRR